MLTQDTLINRIECCYTPHGTGKSSVLVFAKGEKAKEAEQGGADYVGAEDGYKIQNDNWFEFDVVVATPDMMGVVGRLGKVLGPKGLMPNPKAGTVTMDVAKAIADIKAGKIEYRLIRQTLSTAQLKGFIRFRKAA